MSEQLALGREGASPNTSVEGYMPKAETSTAPSATGSDAGYLRVFVFALFSFFGGNTSLNDVIIPRLKELAYGVYARRPAAVAAAAQA